MDCSSRILLKCGNLKQLRTFAHSTTPRYSFNLKCKPRKNVNMGAAASTGGIGGSPPPPAKGYGGDDGKDDPESDDSGVLWKGWRERVAADPEFPYKVIIEQIIGVGAAVIGDMSSRPNWGLNELDFVFSTLIVGSIMNFSLLYLLAPTLASLGGGGTLIQKMFSEQTLKNWGVPGGHMFERGSYTIGKRLINFGYKGFIFGFIGLAAGIIGTCVSNGLLMVRKKMDPEFELQNQVPNVWKNAGAWALHMSVSSNLRYQMLNGMDMVLVGAMPNVVFKAWTAIVRTLNNIIGGVSFVTIAKITGVQATAPKNDIDTKDLGKQGK
eukprot:TRINITY_DN23063_c0_g1_i1.p1 TRINITY_DN23063_c0_g1~~TRINITY_DN23063_c0_g1_i1.p1  ORF type:complete len:324 (-),score=57.29 TRINITY_DN23063_c0_g1_i1:508-1479(-)